jgi:hypothetical protein
MTFEEAFIAQNETSAFLYRMYKGVEGNYLVQKRRVNEKEEQIVKLQKLLDFEVGQYRRKCDELECLKNELRSTVRGREILKQHEGK